MNLNDYQQLALRTAGHMNTDQMLINSALGLPGEVAEILELLENGSFACGKPTNELGDLCWYIAIGFYAIKCNFDLVTFVLSSYYSEDFVKEMVISTGKYSDYIKKVYFQGHKMEQGYCAELLVSCYWAVFNACQEWNLDLNQILQDNIDKLKRRYPDGFEVARSINRVEE
jgi:NTP pyrophosphatase (non-canonical NTP hydrolase)